MPAGFSSSDKNDLIESERQVQERIGEMNLDVDALAAVSNIFRVASTARYHMEREVLAAHDLSFTAFTVLWVLWIWGEQEARHLAAESGISKGTLTGVARTLERRGLLLRRTHPNDRRLVLLSVSDEAAELMATLFPRFNAEETTITKVLSSKEQQQLANILRKILRGLEVDASSPE